MLNGLFYDLRFALRGLRRDRGFTLAAVVMLALAIALNVTVFTIMDAMLFRGYPLVKRNDRLVYLQEQTSLARVVTSYADLEEWRAQAHTFEGMAFVGERRIAFRDADTRLIDTMTWTVSSNLFGLLQVRPTMGRDFLPSDEVPGAAPVAILSHRFWETRFNKRPDIVGLTVHVNDQPARIVGVMPERFEFPSEENLWMPVVRTAELLRRGATTGSGYVAVGRLRDGISVEEAGADLQTISRRLESEYPATNRGLGVAVIDNLHWHAGPNAPMIYGSLWAGAWFVLLIACANLANLTLVRTVGRSRDFTTRIALGAGQARMMRQIFIESLTVACLSGALAWWLTLSTVHTWAAATASHYQILDYRIDWRDLAYLAVVTTVAALMFSLAPIIRIGQLNASGALRADARGVTRGQRGKHLGATLVAGQMALAIVLLSGAGVLVRSLVQVVGAETGVRDPEHILVGRVRLPSDKYGSPEKQIAYFDRFEHQLSSIPGISDVAVSTVLPVFGADSQRFEVEGRTDSSDSGQAAQFVTVASGYFRLLGTSVVAGRGFDDGDRGTSVPVAIVNQSFANTFWPGEQPLGNHLRIVNRNPTTEWRTVVGVVSNVMQGDATRQRFKPLVYVPFQQQPSPRPFFLARTSTAVGQVAQPVQTELQTLDPDVLLEDFTTLKAKFAFDGDFMDVEHMELGKDAAIAPVFAIMALLLAAVGLYAVIAHSVGQRTKEIGVRIAIGAAAKDVRAMVFREGMLPVLTGVLVSLAASLAVNRILQSQLVGVSPHDLVTMAGAPAVLVAVALLACHVPARRAINVDPAVALRHE